jgi:hypothetical protein
MPAKASLTDSALNLNPIFMGLRWGRSGASIARQIIKAACAQEIVVKTIYRSGRVALAVQNITAGTVVAVSAFGVAVIYGFANRA